jgi:hypothetical protein
LDLVDSLQRSKSLERRQGEGKKYLQGRQGVEYGGIVLFAILHMKKEPSLGVALNERSYGRGERERKEEDERGELRRSMKKHQELESVWSLERR